MKPPAALAILLALAALSTTAHAADQSNEPELTIVLDHAKLTKWVLQDFPDGLPFDLKGMPTDDDRAKKFWALIGDWPVNVSGQVAGLAPAISQVCAEAGLPVYFTPGALKALEAAGAQKRLFTISDSVRKAVVIIGRLAGVEKTIIMPFGLIVVGPGEGDEIKQLVAAPPRLEFRWRANYTALFKKAFPDGISGEEPSDEDMKKVMQIATSIRCDVVVPGEAKLDEFLRWMAAVSQQSFSIDEAACKEATESGRTVGPVDVRFALFVDALNAALEGTGLAATAEETHFQVGPGKPKNTFRWRESYWDKIHAELGQDWDGTEPTDEERQRVCEIVAGTRCDLILVEKMVLREFLRWVANSSQMNIVLDPAVFKTGTPSSPPVDPDGGFPASESAFTELPETPKVQPIALRDVPSSEALTAALEPLGLRAVPGGNGGLLIVRANSFRWREDCRARVEKAFPNGYDSDNATAEEQDLAARTILETQCDLIVAEETELPQFLLWLSRASEVNIAARWDGEPLSVQPLVMRFTTFGEGLEAALAGTGLVCAGMEGPGLLFVPEGLTKEEVEE